MTFITIDQPTYTTTLPISKIKLKFRCFLAKEDKLLLIAKESGDPDDINNAIKQVLQNCIITKNIDVESLPTIDVEYFYYQLSARTKGDLVESKYICQHTLENGEECGNILTLSVDLLELNVTKTEIDYNIPLNISSGVVMKYPELKVLNIIRKFGDDLSVIYPLIAKCIDYGYMGDKIIYAKDVTEEDLITFLETLSREQLYKIIDWMIELPSIKKTFDIICDNCGTKHTVKLDGLLDFFT